MLFLPVVILVLAGCRQLQPSEIDETIIVDWAELTLLNDEITSATKVLELEINNLSVNQFGFGERFIIEKKDKDEWYFIPYKSYKSGFRGFKLLQLFIPGESKSLFNADLSILEKTLASGEYRVLIPVDTIDGKGYLAANFSIL